MVRLGGRSSQGLHGPTGPHVKSVNDGGISESWKGRLPQALEQWMASPRVLTLEYHDFYKKSVETKQKRHIPSENRETRRSNKQPSHEQPSAHHLTNDSDSNHPRVPTTMRLLQHFVHSWTRQRQPTQCNGLTTHKHKNKVI